MTTVAGFQGDACKRAYGLFAEFKGFLYRKDADYLTSWPLTMHFSRTHITGQAVTLVPWLSPVLLLSSAVRTTGLPGFVLYPYRAWYQGVAPQLSVSKFTALQNEHILTSHSKSVQLPHTELVWQTCFQLLYFLVPLLLAWHFLIANCVALTPSQVTG